MVDIVDAKFLSGFYDFYYGLFSMQKDLTFYPRIKALFVSSHKVLYTEDQLLISFYTTGSMMMNNDEQQMLTFSFVDNECHHVDAASSHTFKL